MAKTSMKIKQKRPAKLTAAKYAAARTLIFANTVYAAFVSESLHTKVKFPA